MTMTIELSPELEQQIREAAARSGQAPELYVVRRLAQDLQKTSDDTAAIETVSWEEFEAALDELTLGNETSPVLTTGATTREGIYGDHD